MVIGLLATFGVIGSSIGIVSTAEAGPKVSDGMAGRFFMVTVKELGSGGAPFENCYSFLDDDGQTWIDPPFPGGPGTWQDEDSNGVITHYTTQAEAFGGLVTLVQVGQVTPSFSKGQSRITAFSAVTVLPPLVEETLIVEFVSTGYEVDACPIPDPE